MTVLLIPLNNLKSPAKNFMTDELAEQISKSDFYKKNKNIIEKSRFIMELSKLSPSEQLDSFKGFMSKQLVMRLNKELPSASKGKSKTKVKSGINFSAEPRTPKKIAAKLNKSKKSSITKKITKTKYKNKNKNKNIFNLKRSSILVRGGAASNIYTLETLMGIIIFIMTIIYFLNPQILNSFNKNRIKKMSNISTDKNSERLVFLVITNRHDNYFLKISPSIIISTKEETNQVDIRNINSDSVGEYIYECLIYEEMNRRTNVTYNGNDLNTYVSEILEWDIININRNSSNFMVNLDGGTDLNTITTTFGNMTLCECIRRNKWSMKRNNNFCYSIVKEYNGFSTLMDYIDNSGNSHVFNNLLPIFRNACAILNLFYQHKAFCHWDLHSGNLLVNENTGDIKLFDFDLSEVYNSISDIRTRYQFCNMPGIIVKPVFPHLFDYYRLIIETINSNDYLRDFIFNETNVISNTQLIEYFYNNDILNRINNHYTQEEINKYKEISEKPSIIIRFGPDIKTFYETLFYFYNTQ